MARSIWKGALTFGLVNIPIRLYPATQPKDVRFHLYDRRTGKRVRYERVTREEEGATFEPEPAFPLPSTDGQDESDPAITSAPEVKIVVSLVVSIMGTFGFSARNCASAQSRSSGEPLTFSSG